jgi:hypothetical protein
MSLALALALVGAALAHHDVAVSQVSASSLPSSTAVDVVVPSPRLQFGVSHDVVALGRMQRGTEAYEGTAQRAISVHTLNPSFGVRWATQTSLTATLPVGLVHTRLDGVSGAAGGVGDLRVEVGQGVSARPEAARPWSVAVRAGFTAPTGRYEPDPAVRVTDVSAGEGGAILVTNYDLRASLGAGSWGLTTGVRAGGSLGRVELAASGDLLLPVGLTPDSIQWGATVDARLELTGAVAARRVGLGAGVEGRWHFADRLHVIDAQDNVPIVAGVGQRSGLAVSAGISGRVSDGVVCGLRVRVPVWQQVQGVQMVESVASSVGCRFAVGM